MLWEKQGTGFSGWVGIWEKGPLRIIGLFIIRGGSTSIPCCYTFIGKW